MVHNAQYDMRHATCNSSTLEAPKKQQPITGGERSPHSSFVEYCAAVKKPRHETLTTPHNIISPSGLQLALPTTPSNLSILARMPEPTVRGTLTPYSLLYLLLRTPYGLCIQIRDIRVLLARVALPLASAAYPSLSMLICLQGDAPYWLLLFISSGR